ncbi:uncharacterized protein LOC135838555 [Planococcus citri]|uniref:uncharacterized protein LOC135838555 n=1 Tax=Planococcus citri TaxID=170843 RepID=UPI0031F75448
MNSLKVILSCSLLLASAYGSPTYGRDDPTSECNVTFPVLRNLREVFADSMFSGNNNIIVSQQEKCHLNCRLQKTGIFDENSNVRNGLELVDEINDVRVGRQAASAKYTDIQVLQMYNIIASTKTIEDKCQKAYEFTYRFMESFALVGTAKVLEGMPSLKLKIYNAIETGQEVAGGLKKMLTEYERTAQTKRLEYLF